MNFFFQKNEATNVLATLLAIIDKYGDPISQQALFHQILLEGQWTTTIVNKFLCR